MRAELTNYHRFADLSEQIVAVNQSICEARPPKPGGGALPATTGDEKMGLYTRSLRSSPPR